MAESRDYILGVRLSETERYKLAWMASKAGMKPSEYVRNLLNKQEDKRYKKRAQE